MTHTLAACTSTSTTATPASPHGKRGEVGGYAWCTWIKVQTPGRWNTTTTGGTCSGTWRETVFELPDFYAANQWVGLNDFRPNDQGDGADGFVFVELGGP